MLPIGLQVVPAGPRLGRRRGIPSSTPWWRSGQVIADAHALCSERGASEGSPRSYGLCLACPVTLAGNWANLRLTVGSAPRHASAACRAYTLALSVAPAAMKARAI